MMQNACMVPFMQGCGMGAGLIIAIGAQNAFVLKQGIMRNYVFATALTCSLADALLIALGVGGLGTLLVASPLLLAVARWGGVVFLLYYSVRAFRSAIKASTVVVAEGPERPTLRQTIVTLLVVTFFNPHTYLDAVVVLGCIGAQFSEEGKRFFAGGAILSSFLWFFGVSYGARYLSPLFKSPLSWRILDVIVGCIMLGIAFSLIFWEPNVGVVCKAGS